MYHGINAASISGRW